MKSLPTNPYSTHDAIFLLLPWYVNNTLHGTELKDVENHLKVCLICKRELINLKKLSFVVNQEGSFDSAALASFSHLKERIHQTDNNEIPLPQVIIGLKSKGHKRSDLKTSFLDRPKFAMVAILVLAIVIPSYVNVGKLISYDYRTLSDSETSKPLKNEIRIVFSEGLKQQQIDAIVSKIHGQIVSGPNEKSVYTVQINQGNTTKKILEALEQLRENTNIIFAEPAYDLLSSMQMERGTKL
jgi:hypothetical protein